MLTGGEVAGRPGTRGAAVKTVSQVILRLERDKSDVFGTVRDEVLEWVRWKAGKPLPNQAWDGRSFEIDEVGAQRAAAAYLDEPRYWAARVDDACREVAQRTWITEIGIGLEPSGRVVLGCRLIVSARGDNPRFQPSVPAFVARAVRGGQAFLDDRPISMDPWLIHTKEHVNQLYGLLCAKGRRTDVIIISLAENETDSGTAIVSTRELHRLTLGAAHVGVLTGSAAYMLTDLVGKEFSVFNRAVRTYRPKFDPEVDEPRRHPLAMPPSIGSWQEEGIQGVEAFERFLVRSALQQTVSTSDLEKVLPPFSEVRRLATSISMDAARRAGASQTELLTLYEEDNSKLRAALDEEKALHESLLEAAGTELEEAQRLADEAKTEVRSLRLRIRGLEAALKARAGPILEPDLPDNLDELKDWAEQNLAGSVMLANRALRGAKESDYEDPLLAYKALLLLRDQYVPMRREGGDDQRRAYEEACRALGLEDAPSIAMTRVGEQGDEYYVQHSGRKRLLDRHLRKGTSRESRHCFRLYFFWDEESEQVVIGWLTSHLDTRQS